MPEKRISAASACLASLRVSAISELSVLNRKCGLSLPLITASSARASADSACAAASDAARARRACSQAVKAVAMAA